MKRILALLLAAIMVFSLAACNNQDDTKKPTSELEDTTVQLDKYSIGLDNDGFYEDYEKYAITDFNIKDVEVDVEEVLKYIASGGDDTVEVKPEDIDAYVYEYANNVLASLGLATRETVEDKYYVSCTLAFFVDNEQVVDMGHTEPAVYQANATGDAIVKSFIGHKANDEYEVDYVFPEEDTSFAGKTAKVKIKITSINDNDPLSDGAVEKNAEALKEYFNTADTTENFLKEIRPLIAYTHLLDYFTYYFQTYEGIEAPQELVDHEIYRFNCRLKSFGYTMSDYIEASKITEAEIIDYCKSLVVENLLLMCVYKQSGESVVTDDELKTMYAEDYEYTVGMLGIPYMKLDIMREVALNHAAIEATLLYNGEKYVPDDKYFQKVEIDADTSTDATDSTTPTEETTETTDTNTAPTEGVTAE